MLFCRTKYINSSADPINYRLSEYLIGGGEVIRSNNSDMTGADSISSSSPPELSDPEARSPLKPNDCDNRFLHLPEGIDLALHRTKLWSKYAKDLINYIDKRSNLEADHARNLTKLAQSVKPILKEEKYLPLQSIYLKALDNDLDNSCAMLANCSLLLGHKFIETLAARRAEHEKIRKQIKSEWNRELKRTHEALNSLRKARMIYFQRKQEYERLKALSNLSVGESSGSSDQKSTSTGSCFVGVDGCYGGNYQNSKCERKKRAEEEVCMRAQEAEIVYRNAINEANARTRSCEELKKNLLIRIRELVCQCDQTLKAVTIGYFECQHNLYKPIVGQFGSLGDSAKLYEPGREYGDYVSHLPEFTETLRKCNNNGILNSDYKFDSTADPMSMTTTITSSSSSNDHNQRQHQQHQYQQTATINYDNKKHNSTRLSELDNVNDSENNEDHLKISKDIELPITSSVEEIDSDRNFANGFRCSTLPKTLLTSAHHFRKLKTPSRCRNCDAYVCFQGLECINCGLTCHTKCRGELVTINCVKPVINSGRRSRGFSKKMTIFGVDLKSHEDEVPYIVVKCISELDRRGIMVKGLYRVSGVKSRVEKLCQMFETCNDSIDLSDVHPNVIANVLKLYLRQLPEPLITFKLYPEFIRIAKLYPSSSDGNGPDTDDPSIAGQLISQYKQFASSLPNVYYQTLAFLCYHLKRVGDQSKINNMPPSNLGIVFGPTLLRSSEGDSLSSLVDTGHQARAVQLLITYVDKIFELPSMMGSTCDEPDCGQHAEDSITNTGNQKVIKPRFNNNRTQFTLTLEGNNNLTKGIDKANDKAINKSSKEKKMANNNTINTMNYKNSNNNNMSDNFNDNNNSIIGHNHVIDGKSRSLERERLSPTPSIYSSSAVIKLSGQQIITGPSSLMHSSLPGNYDDSDDRLNRSNSNGINNNNTIGGSRHSLYEARRQFFASPTSQSPLSSLTSSSSPLSSSSASSSSIRPHSLISGSISLNSHHLNDQHHNNNHHPFRKQSSSPLSSSSTMSSPTSTSSPSNELPITMSSLSLTRSRKASIVSSGSSLAVQNTDNSNNSKTNS